MSFTSKESVSSVKKTPSEKSARPKSSQPSDHTDSPEKNHHPIEPIIINVISGKGGTGKTLFTATVANAVAHRRHRVLVIDLDLFVRGMTVMSQGEDGFIVVKNDDWEWTVMSYFRRYKDLDSFSPFDKPSDYRTPKSDKDSENPPPKKFAVIRNYSFDLLPAVARLNDYGDPDCLSGKERVFIEKVLKHMIDCIQEQQGQGYEYIFLDSRAGYDKVIAAAHDVSKFSIIIGDDDHLSSSTTQLLKNQLKDNDNRSIVLLVRNKTRRDVQMEGTRSDYEFMGDIPYDLNVISAYGNESCLIDVEHTEYKKAVVNIWNKICLNFDLNAHLKDPTVRKNPSYVEVNWINGEPMKKEPVLYSLSPVRRAIFSVSLCLIVTSLALSSGFASTAFYDGIVKFLSEAWQGMIQDPSRGAAAFVGLVGLTGALSTLLWGRKK